MALDDMTQGDIKGLVRRLSEIGAEVADMGTDPSLTPEMVTILTNAGQKIGNAVNGMTKLSFLVSRADALARLAKAQAELDEIDQEIRTR